jgi:probable phosphoglycerate mutase
MKIIFVTHGQTMENVDGIVQGQLIGGTLSELGKNQAEAVAERIREEKIDAAYCSDLSRAVETARLVLAHHKGIKLIHTFELRERDFGIYQGRRKSEFENLDEKWFAEDFQSGETIEALCSRIGRFLEGIRIRYSGATVLLVGHRVAGMALECIVKRIPMGDFSGIKEMQNGDMQIFYY